MKRRSIVQAAALALAIASGRVPGQAAPRPRIGYLSLIPLTDPPSPERQAFVEGLAAEGLLPGRDLEIVYASAEGNLEFLDDIARDLVARRPALIVAAGAIVLQALQRATHEIPVVMLAVGDPVGVNLVHSLPRPGGNITGSSFRSSELAAKRVQLLSEAAPGLRRMAVLFDARNRNAQQESEVALAAARKLGLTPLRLPFGSAAGLRLALQQASALDAQSLYAAFEGVVIAGHGAEVAAFAQARRMPSISGFSRLVEAGFLMAYAPDIAAMFRRGAYFVARILQGVKPGDLPVEQASRFEFVLNLKTARALGIVLSQELMLRATRVIE